MGWKTETASTQILLTGDDNQDINRKPSAIWVVTAGDVHWQDSNPQGKSERNEHTLALAAGVYPISMSKLFATGTTAVILGLYD